MGDERVKDVLRTVQLPKTVYVSGEFGLGGPVSDSYDETYYSDLARALHAAGLLRTGLEQRAIAACERYAREVPADVAPMPKSAQRECYEVGVDSRAAKQPKPRWVVKYLPGSGRPWGVLDTLSGPTYEAKFRNEADANADRDRRNALASESPR